MKPYIRKEIEIKKYMSGRYGDTVEINTTVFLFSIPIFKSLKLVFHQS